MPKNSRILVTGGAGYIGSHFVSFLVQNGGHKAENILVIDNLSLGHKESLPKGVVFKKQDLRERDSLIKTVKEFSPDVVFHFASNSLVGESMKFPRKYLGDNVQGAVNLLESLKASNCKYFVFSSSCSVYGIPNKVPITEEEPIKPISPYGKSKSIIEKTLERYDKAMGIKYVSLRYFNAAGADFGIGESHSPETHLIPLVMESILGNRDELKIFGTDYPTSDGTCIRDYIHVTDLAEAHVKGWEKLMNSNLSLTLNLGTGKGVSVKEIADKASNITGIPVPTKEVKKRPGDPPELVADPSKAEKILSWKAKKSIDDILSSAWEWHNDRKY